ncbi:hypothetical protein TrLO_g15534 [Triparma laevis f. longispina]|nr:hypothetical protein TrLO_g15534 [Triparma laevis f. longispina]
MKWLKILLLATISFQVSARDCCDCSSDNGECCDADVTTTEDNVEIWGIKQRCILGIQHPIMSTGSNCPGNDVELLPGKSYCKCGRGATNCLASTCESTTCPEGQILNATRASGRCWFKNCDNDTDRNYCCMGEEVFPLDDDLNPSDSDVDLDEYDIVSLLGVGTAIVFFGTVIGLAASKRPKKYREEGSSDSDSDCDSHSAEEALIPNAHDHPNNITV